MKNDVFPIFASIRFFYALIRPAASHRIVYFRVLTCLSEFSDLWWRLLHVFIIILYTM